MKKLFFILGFLIYSLLYGQADLPLRVELELAKDAEDYNCAAIGKNGVVVFYEGNLISPDSTDWYFISYDTNLNKNNNYAIPMPVNLRLVNSFYTEEHLYILFQQYEQKKVLPKTFMVDFDVSEKKIASYEIVSLHDQNIFDLKVVENNILIFSNENTSNYIYVYEVENKLLTSPQFTDGKITSVEFCEIDTFQHVLYWGIVATNTAKISSLTLFITDYKGKIIRNINFPSYSGYYYNSARMALADSAHAIIIGTYKNEKDKYSGNSNSGVYTIPFIGNRMGDPQFYNYSAIKSKDSLNLVKIKEKNLNLQVLIGPVFHNDKQFAFVTELFYPEYNYNSSNNTFDSYNYGSTYMPASTSFAGYRYINAFITTFDKNGNLLWDNYLPFSNILTFRLAQRVSVFFIDQDAVIYYPYNSYLTSTMVNGYEIKEPLTTIELESRNKRDNVDYSRNPRIENWYGNYFLFSGYQFIKNNSQSAKSKRYVFFLNKLLYK
jgi:hypothetical protein